MKGIKFFLLLFMLVGCNTRINKLKCIQQGREAALARYFNEPIDSVQKWFRYTDSNYVNSMGLTLQHFFDYRDTLPDSQYWRYGVVCYNANTGNWFVHASRLRGKMYYRTDRSGNQIFHGTDERDYLRRSNFFFYRTITDSLASFSGRNVGAALKLSSIFNDIPPHLKGKMTRAIAESIIVNFLYDDSFALNNSKIRGAKTRQEIEETYKYAVTISPIEYSKKEHVDTLFAKSQINGYRRFWNHILANSNNQNAFFFYLRHSRLLGMNNEVLVVLNDGLSDNLAIQHSYSAFNVEPIMYTVKIYSGNPIAY